MPFNLLEITIRMKIQQENFSQRTSGIENISTDFSVNQLLQTKTFWRAMTVSHWYSLSL